MKKRVLNHRLFISGFLVLIFWLFLTGCEEAEAGYLAIVENGQTEYVIIRAEHAEDWEVSAALRFRKTIEEKTGVKIAIKDDFERAGTDFTRTDKEIIIGSTNRENAFEAAYDSFEYGYRIFESSERLIILAGSAAGMDTALDTFFSDHFGVDANETDSVSDLCVKYGYESMLKYTSSELPYLDESLSEYTIVCDSDNYLMRKRYSTLVKSAILGTAGIDLPISDHVKDNGKNLLLHMDPAIEHGNFRFHVSGTDMTISISDYYGFDAVRRWLCTAYEARGYFDFKDGYEQVGDYLDGLDSATASDAYAFQRAGANRVMFNNVLWGDSSGMNGRPERDVPAAERHRLTVQMVAAYLPDVFGLQEVRQGERSGMNGIVTLLSDIGYTEVLNPDVLGMASGCTPLFYRTEAITLIASGFTIYEHQPAVQDFSKSMTWGIFTSKADDSRYMVVSTHMCTEDDDIGALQAGELIETVRRVTAEYDCTAIIGGDFNAAYEEKTYKTFTEKAGYRNARDTAPVTSDVRSYQLYPKYSYKLDIMQPEGDVSFDRMGSVDHIFLSDGKTPDLCVFGTVVDDITRSASDHLPIFIDFSFE